MKIEDLQRPGLLTLGLLGVAGLAATALAGFAVGVAVSRDPDAVKRGARGLMRNAARGLEQATLVAAQAREQIGDLWAEAREKAVAEVDEADFARAASRAAAPAAAAAAAAAPAQRPRRQAGPATPAGKRSPARKRGAKAAPTAAAAGDEPHEDDAPAPPPTA